VDGQKIDKVYDLACVAHKILQELLKDIEPEDDSGGLTRDYSAATSALIGCKTVIDQMGRLK
jgi:hypothetical protein